MKHRNTAPQDHITTRPKREFSTRQKISSLAGLTATLMVGAGIAADQANTKPAASVAAPMSREAELRTAYIGPVEVTSAQNTGEITTDDMGEKRGVITIHLGGAAINEATAHSTGDPDYTYAQNPITNVVLPSGQKYPGVAKWTDKSTGDATINPLLQNFSGSKSVTYDYNIELGAYSLILPATPTQGTDLQEMDARYDAGTVAVTGANGEITSVEIIPRPADTPPIQIQQLDSHSSDALIGH